MPTTARRGPAPTTTSQVPPPRWTVTGWPATTVRDAAGAPVRGLGHDELLGIIARGTGQNEADLVGHLPFIDAQARLDVGSLFDQIAFWQENKLVDAAAQPAAMFDLSFVPDQLNVPARMP